MHGNRSKWYLWDDVDHDVDDYNDDDVNDDKSQNSHNLANFEATTSRFCIVVDINDTYGLYYHAKS